MVARAKRGKPEELQKRLGNTSSNIRRARRRVKHERTERKARAGKSSVKKSKRRESKGKSEALPGRLRVRVIGALLLLMMVIVLGRAAKLQLMDGGRYRDAAERQSAVSARIQAKRGVIQDRHGAELAITVDVDSVYAEPRRIDDPRGVASKLAPILRIDAKKLKKRLSGDRAFAYLKRRVDSTTAEKVNALGIAGVGTQPEPKRFYSNISLAAHVLGFTGWDGAGKAGVERTFDDELRGKSYEVPGLRDALGNRVFSDGFVPQSVLEGADVRLTIDRTIQHAAEVALEKAVTSHSAKGGVAIVLDPYDGDVLALASNPTYNPNNLSRSKTNSRLNRAVSAVYEPGSTLKMVTIAAALEEGTVEPDDRIDCEGGSWRVGGRTIGDANHEFDELTVTEIMKVSSNICAAKIGLELGRERLHRWLLAFGFGEKTGIELPGELNGLIRPWKQWREIALANIAFGQGIAVTPLQLAQATSVIASGGFLVRPRLVKAIAEKSGERIVPERPKRRRVLSRSTASRVARMMIEVTKEGGTAKAARVPGFAVAGKTGTAQKIDPVTRAYSHELYVASFVGFVPADRPEVVIAVMIDEPSGSIYGGTVAAPAFAEIAMAALSAREVFPKDRGSKERFLTSYRKAQEVPHRAEPASEEEGPKSAEFEQDSGDPPDLVLDSALSAKAQALLGLELARAPSTPNRMPDFAGLELHEVLNRSAEIRCDPVVTGTGRVVSQSPRPGARIREGAPCELRLSPR